MKAFLTKVAVLICFFHITFYAIHAQSTYVLATDNPFSPVSPGHFASPALGDIDADGDLDLFVGQYNSNEMLFYRNTGTAQQPVYTQQTGTDNPLDIYTSNSGCNAPVLVDIDADTDLDVFVGIWSYIIRHLRNDGDAAVPDFIFQTGANNPLDHIMTEGICSYPAFVDIDNDMDLDVFITDGNGNLDFNENTGDQIAPVFELDTINNVLGHVALTARAKIAFHDVSGDGLKDAVISHDTDEPELLYFENTGTAGDAIFEERTGASNPFDGITGTEALAPVFADIDDDGDKDLVLGTWQSVRLYEAVKASNISDVVKNGAYFIYPNPAVRHFTVQGDAIHHVDVIDQQGRHIRQIQTSANSTFVDMAEEADGIYFVRLITDAGIIIIKVVMQ
ncbi:MAG TPA: T9SS type A sorting domain-containing protein [Saprospiraceae bacterium]|nr:T9SS type A sorting domain-containing protein [Saprospiraceae bacterium]